MNIQKLVDMSLRTVETHRLGEGDYTRWLWQDEKQTRQLGTNEYGCADAANILYTLGHFVREPEKRAEWVRILQGMQDPKTGLFHEVTHHTIHTTAHCLAALELFDALPLYPLTQLLPLMEPEALYAFLNGLNWEDTPWPQSHQGAGLYAAMANSRTLTPEWQKAYFGWLREHADPVTALGLKDRRGAAPLCHQLFGWFHYLFNHEYAHQAFPYPEQLIDTCIDLYKRKALHSDYGTFMGRDVGFMEIDWVFVLNRATRQTAHRFDEAKELLWDFAQDYLPWLMSLDETTHDRFNDLHMLFGALCAVAELQQALPGRIETDIPLKNVLDRRPFI